MQTTVDFLRHGEVSGGQYYRGSTDDPLTEKGWQQMQQAVVKQNWDHIISSPLQRCCRFAQQLSQQTATPLTILPDWQEIHFGDWEGKTAEQIPIKELTQFYQQPLKHTPNKAETMTDFILRISHGWQRLITQHPDQHILLITHAGVIRSLFHCLLDLPVSKTFNLQLDHASMTRFQCYQQNPENFISLVFHNFTVAKIY